MPSLRLSTKLIAVTLLCAPAALWAKPSASEKVDNPEYASWAKCKVGTIAVFKVTEGETEKSVTKELIELTDDKAVINVTTTTAGKLEGEKKVQVPRLISAAKAKMLNAPTGMTGDGTETVKAAGREFSARWVAGSSGKTWYSEEAPGGIVRRETADAGKKTTTELVEIKAAKKKKSKADEEESASLASAKPGEWMTNYRQALALAKKENKMLFVDFTGSDWCGWCIKLDKEVFTKKTFKKWANEKFILVKLDFPKKKALPVKLKAQNDKLAKKFGVQGFPTILVLDGEEEVVARLGYAKGGPKAWIAQAEAEIGGDDDDGGEDE